MSLFSPTPWSAMFGRMFGGSVRAGDDRLRNYARFLRAYEGYKTPQIGNPSESSATSALRHGRLRFNFNRPIVELGAAFLAPGALKWKIDIQGEGEQAEEAAARANKAAFDIWDRSGSDRTMLEAARTAGIYGDIVGLATQDEQQRPRIEFVCPDICTPQFKGSDAQELTYLEIAWVEETEGERRTNHMETYTAAGREVFIDGKIQADQSIAFDRIPAAWIRNLSIKGQSFGLSDLDGIVELVEAYDHVMGKREKIIDYYAGPSIVFEGCKKGDVARELNTALYLPAGAKASFLEWNGTAPDIELQLDRLRNDIAEISQVPAVAFGRQDSGLSQISGVALRILYGPLLAKTNAKRASWGPALERLMWICLRAEGIDVPLEAVNVVWPDPVPVNEQEAMETAALSVEKGLASRRTAMETLGIEDSEAEWNRVREETRLKTLSEAVEAGLSLPVALAQAGYPEEEIPDLLRADVVDDVTQ